MATTDFGAVAVADGYSAPVSLLPYHEETFAFFTSGNLSVANRVAAAIVGVGGTVVDVRAALDTAPVGASVILDVNKNGVTMFTTAANAPTIAAGQTVSTTTLPDVVILAPGDLLTVDVDQIGASTPGAGLYLSVTIKRSNVA